MKMMKARVKVMMKKFKTVNLTKTKKQKHNQAKKSSPILQKSLINLLIKNPKNKRSTRITLKTMILEMTVKRRTKLFRIKNQRQQAKLNNK